MIFRLAKQEDLEEIITIYNEAIVEGKCNALTQKVSSDDRQDWLRFHLSSRYPIYITEIDGSLAGWCSISPYRPGRQALEKTAEISYYIGKKYRGKGIGEKLTRYTISELPKYGFTSVFAILLDVNFKSVKLLEKIGFKLWGHLPDIAHFKDYTCGQFIYGLKL